MKPMGDEEQLRSLVKEVDKLSLVFPEGYMKRQIDRYSFYEVGGLKFTADEVMVGLHYAGLAVLARDMKFYIDQHSRDDTELFRSGGHHAN